MRKIKNLLYRIRIRAGQTLTEERGISTVELILVLVGIFTPYYGVGIRCMA